MGIFTDEHHCVEMTQEYSFYIYEIPTLKETSRSKLKLTSSIKITDFSSLSALQQEYDQYPHLYAVNL